MSRRSILAALLGALCGTYWFVVSIAIWNLFHEPSFDEMMVYEWHGLSPMGIAFGTAFMLGGMRSLREEKQNGS